MILSSSWGGKQASGKGINDRQSAAQHGGTVYSRKSRNVSPLLFRMFYLSSFCGIYVQSFSTSPFNPPDTVMPLRHPSLQSDGFTPAPFGRVAITTKAAKQQTCTSLSSRSRACDSRRSETAMPMKNTEEDATTATKSNSRSAPHNKKQASPFNRFLIPIWNTVTQQNSDEKELETRGDAVETQEDGGKKVNSLANVLPIDSMKEILSGLPSLSFPIPFLSPEQELDIETIEEENAVTKPFRKYTVSDKSEDGFGPLLPLAERIDELTGGWGLSYADLAPETPSTPAGVAFLATNICYVVAGILLTTNGELVLGTMTELAGGVSLWYHYEQLKYSGQVPASEVRLALLTDYIFAGTALVTGLVYAAMLGISAVPLQAVITGGLAIGCLSVGWVYEYGIPYIIWHSLWHILSAYTGYLVGQARIDNIAETAAHVTTTFLI
jgi:hypothetical protein